MKSNALQQFLRKEESVLEGKTEYLQMIQEPICRMSSASAILKGFAATIVAGISSISYCSIHIVVLCLSFFPVIGFAVLDVYYLRRERLFRFLFDQVREGKHEVDYSMEVTKDPREIRIAKARTCDCIRSPSIYLFYPLMIAILCTVVALKICGVI